MHWLPLTLLCALSLASAALAQVESAYMIAVKRTSVLFGIVYGWLLFRKPRLCQRLLANGLMVTGVAATVLTA